jgi:hypothetical protein
LIDVKQKYLQKDLIPDANGTLRFTCGHVRGYAPADATYPRAYRHVARRDADVRDRHPLRLVAHGAGL